MEKDTNLLPEWDKDLAERVAAFNERVTPLLGKYELGIGAMAQLNHEGRVISQPTLVSTRRKAEDVPQESLPITE